MRLETDFRGTRLGNTELFFSIVNDKLNLKINVPTFKDIDIYMKSIAKHNKMGNKSREISIFAIL